MLLSLMLLYPCIFIQKLTFATKVGDQCICFRYLWIFLVKFNGVSVPSLKTLSSVKFSFQRVFEDFFIFPCMINLIEHFQECFPSFSSSLNPSLSTKSAKSRGIVTRMGTFLNMQFQSVGIFAHFLANIFIGLISLFPRETGLVYCSEAK